MSVKYYKIKVFVHAVYFCGMMYIEDIYTVNYDQDR
jgi:hypothetical protein